MPKKRPILQRAIALVLEYLESRAPVFTRLLRYHSKIIHPTNIAGVEIFSRNTRWHEPKYKESFVKLALADDVAFREEFAPEIIPISILATKDYEIHGHIKAPIIASSGLALSYIPLARLSLTDSYPLPFFRTRNISGTIIFIPNIENYFHLMVDYLLPPICAIMREPHRYGHITFVMQRHFPMVELFGQLLNDLGISTSIHPIGKFDRLKGGVLLFGGSEPRDSGAAFAYPDEMRAIGNLADKYLSASKPPSRVFVTRSKAQRRRITNEIELRDVLERYGFKTVELRFGNPLEQIALFRNAEIIMSVHGASLTNLIWAKTARVIELFPSNLRPKHYLNIAAQMGLEYQPIIGSEGDNREDFIIDIEEIERALSR
ncbi:MAG: glycosyltransferase family 61 protein [Alphaproteobacteria bacterium]